jgi:branched-chain amino acid transport system substrate-binding protein
VNALTKAYDKFGSATPASTAPSVFVYNYYNAAWALVRALNVVKGDISAGQAKLRTALRGVQLPAGYGRIKLDQNRNAITDNYVQQLQKGASGLTVKTILRIPAVDQSFGGTFSPSTPAPGRTSPKCEKRSLPWIGKAQRVG